MKVSLAYKIPFDELEEKKSKVILKMYAAVDIQSEKMKETINESSIK